MNEHAISVESFELVRTLMVASERFGEQMHMTQARAEITALDALKTRIAALEEVADRARVAVHPIQIFGQDESLARLRQAVNALDEQRRSMGVE